MLDQCFECGRPAEYDHHVVPRARGGTKTVPLCDECHGKAHHRDKAMTTGQMTREAHAAKRARGEKNGGMLPFGWTIDPCSGPVKTLIPCQAEQDIIADIKACRASGMTLVEIASDLNQRGVKRKSGAHWEHSYISRLLRRPAALGLRLCGGIDNA